MEKLVKAADYIGKSAYPFPDEEKLTQSKRRSEAYFRSCCQAMTSRFVNNLCAQPYDGVIEGRRSIRELRLYRKGLNSPNKYKSYFVPLQKEVNAAINKGLSIPESRARKTTINISWGVIPILPKKIGSDALGYMKKINYDVQTSAIDYEALISKKTMVNLAKLYADDRTKWSAQQVNQAAGRQVIQPKDPSEMPGGMAFNDPKSVDTAAAVGVFFLEQEAALQTLLTKSAEEGVEPVIFDQCKDDFLTIGTSGVRVATNENSKIVVNDWIDLENCAYPWSQYLDHRDMTWFTEYRKMTIGQLRKELKIDENELIKIAKMYANDMGMDNFYMNRQHERNNPSFGMNMMDQIQVDVADCRWLGMKGVDFTVIRNKNSGNLVINDVEGDYEISDKDEREGKKVYNYKNQTVYKAKLILGTGHVFDYGEDNDIGWQKSDTGKMTPIFPIKIVKIGNMSLVERCIEFVDDANLANYKLRIARQKMPAPPNLYIDKAALEGGIMIDGVNYKPHQLMRLLQDEGFLIGDSKDQWGKNGTQSRAVQPIGTDMIGIIAAWVNDRDNSIAMIDKLTGINDMFSASNPQRKEAVGVSNNLIAGTQNSLTDEVVGYRTLLEQSKKIQVKKWQVVASNMTEEERKPMSINRALKTVKMGSDLNDFDFDIQVHAAITDEEKAEFLQDIKQMRQVRLQSGSGGINEADYMLLVNMVRSGKMVQAQLALSQIITVRKQEDQQQQQAMLQANGEEQRKSEQQSSDNQAKSEQQIGQIEQGNKTNELNLKLRNELALERERHMNAMREAAINNVYGNHKKSA